MTPERGGGSARLVERLVKVEPGEGPALLWSLAYFFFLFSSYYILRPLRDAMGIAGSENRLTWLYMGSLAGTLLGNPIFSALVTRFPRRVFIPVVYRFLILCLIVFYVLMRTLEGDTLLRLTSFFFVWVSIFNLFAISVFWGFMADIFTSRQGARLFGFIAMGGTLGAIAGAFITAQLVSVLGAANLILLSAAILEVAVQCVRRLTKLGAVGAAGAAGTGGAAARAASAEKPPGRGVLGGIRQVARSPYLLGICLFLLLYTISSTFTYFEQARIVRAAITDSADRAAFLARIDLYVNLLTIFMQVFVSARVIQWLGVGGALAVMPLLTMAGFSWLAASATLGVLSVFQTLRRATEYAVSRPAREVLFTVVSREEKYSSKSLIDTFVYRGGDAVGAWADRGLALLGLGAAGIAGAFLPLAGIWAGVAFLLGRRHRRLAAARGEADAAATA